MNRKLYYILSAALLFTAGCSEKVGDSEQWEAEFGQLRITCTPDDQFVVRAANAPASEAFSLTLSDNSKTTRHWNTITDFHNENPLLHYGDYTASVAWGDPETEGPDKPYYTGEKSVTIHPRITNTVSITAKMVKAQVLVRTTKQFRAYFQDVHFTVVTGSGNAFHYYFSSTATPAVPDSQETICVRVGTTLSITGTAFKQAPITDGQRPQVIFPEQKIDATKASTRHVFEFDAADAGSAMLRILLDDTLIETIAIDVELNDGAILD